MDQVLDAIEDFGGRFNVIEMDVRPNSESQFMSSAVVQVTVDGGRTALDDLIAKLELLAEVTSQAR